MMTKSNPSSLMASGLEEQSVSDTLSDGVWLAACREMFSYSLV